MTRVYYGTLVDAGPLNEITTKSGWAPVYSRSYSVMAYPEAPLGLLAILRNKVAVPLDHGRFENGIFYVDSGDVSDTQGAVPFYEFHVMSADLG